MLETDDGLPIGEAIAICRFLEDEHPEPNLMGRNGREKACIEMWERRAYDEGMIGAAEAFRNAHPAFIDRGLGAAWNLCRKSQLWSNAGGDGSPDSTESSTSN